MLATIEIIQALVSPVVMVSANGLLCLVFYNRLSAIMNRSSAINKERFDLFTHQAAFSAKEKQSQQIVYIRRRMKVLDCVGIQVFERARWVRRVLYCLLLAVLCMLVCSLTLGLVTVVGSFATIAMGFFVTGTLVMMAGCAAAIWELHLALEPLMFETECIDLAPLEEFAPLEEVAS
jgi:hypothetical protein